MRGFGLNVTLTAKMISLMPRKRSDPLSFDLTHQCPLCGYKIPPSELIHVDGENILCPACWKESPYKRLSEKT